MDLKGELTRQSLMLEFTAECLSLQSVPELPRIVTARVHWLCDYTICTALLPDARGLALWSEDRKAGAAVQIEDEALLARHRAALEDTRAKGSSTVAY